MREKSSEIPDFFDRNIGCQTLFLLIVKALGDEEVRMPAGRNEGLGPVCLRNFEGRNLADLALF